MSSPSNALERSAQLLDTLQAHGLAGESDGHFRRISDSGLEEKATPTRELECWELYVREIKSNGFIDVARVKRMASKSLSECSPDERDLAKAVASICLEAMQSAWETPDYLLDNRFARANIFPRHGESCNVLEDKRFTVQAAGMDIAGVFSTTEILRDNQAVRESFEQLNN
jgi:hypothetical protein